jgi:tetratricopeptide (TPR) repeat protein
MTKRVAARWSAGLGWIFLVLVGCAASPPAAGEAPVQPASALGSYLAARHAQHEFDYDSAMRFMDQALASDPGNFDLTRRAFLLRLSAGHVDEALPLARRIIDLDRESGLASLVLLTDEFKRGAYAAAAARAGAAPRDGAQRYAMPLLLAWAEAGRGRFEPAMAALETMGTLGGLEPLKTLHEGLIADRFDRVDAAETAFEKLVGAGTHPTWRVVEVAGNFMERRSRSEAARRLYESFARGDADAELVADGLDRIAKGVIPPPAVADAREGAAEALFDLATLLNQRDTLDAALIFARLALDLQPKLALAQILVAEIELQQHHPAEAVALYRAIDRASPLSWSARLRAALTLDELDKVDEAAAELRAMSEERPDRSDALVALGDVYRSHERFTEAIAAYDAAIARIGKVDTRNWRVLYSRGICLERTGQWPRAEADLKAALALQPDEPMVLNYLGYSWIDKGQNLTDALKMVERAVELRPEDGYIVDSLGWAYYRLGNFARAAELLERATELLPEDPTINDHLGDAYWRTGRLGEARYQWRRALQFRPEASQIKDIETKLDRGLNKPTAINGG